MRKQAPKKNRKVISIHIETYRQLKEIAARNLRPISSQVKFYVEQDMQKERASDVQETVQTVQAAQ